MIALLLIAALDPASAAIADTLPPELVLVEAQVPPRLVDGVHVVEWKTPPRPGAARVLVSTPRARAWVPVILAIATERPIAARALEAGHVLAEEDVIMERAAARSAPLALELLVGATVKRALPEGVELTTEDVALAPPLPRGTPLSVRVQVGALTVTRAGKLEAAARIGELARVRLDGVSQLARARLLTNTTARIEQETAR